MELRSHVKKTSGPGVHREIAAEETWQNIAPHLRRAGITRLADITGLDYIGIPVYSAIIPRSNDSISVYSGKGFRPVDAKISAAMEAIERFSAWLPLRPDLVSSYDELAAAGRNVLHPGDCNLELTRDYRDDGPISWVRGWDLLNEESVLVPQDGAAYQARLHEQPCYRITTTNGLASGNSIEEALCHALCEVIERDSMTLAELVSNYLPQVLEQDGHLGGSTAGAVDRLRGLHPHVRLDGLPLRAHRAVERFTAAGVEVRIADITSDLGVPGFFAATSEDIGDRTSRGHAGYGTHPDAEVALLRALTECAQARAVDVQAMREDISLPGSEVSKYEMHVRRSSTVDKGSWAWQPADRTVGLDEVESHPSDDVMEDVALMLSRLESAGADRVIAVDLSPPQIPVGVVRVIVPVLESWATDQGRIGARGGEAWRRAVRSLAAEEKGHATAAV
ncbi:YcaO-like family protein [Nocardiopsis halophila]|uniref:YcaO-like family protein n=1 Tax=Nocardiopsis halophila TaxID=141692 RepID=UPI00034C1122|nr:YcaO-like family protein [Nocardiopsis halophila]